MGMSGGGGGAASPSLEERGQMYLMANPGASRADAYKAAQSGLSPLQYDNYTIGRKMVQGDPKLGDPGARVDVKRYGLQMSNLAQGGLMVRGLGQLRDTLDAPSLAPGIQTRMASRSGGDGFPGTTGGDGSAGRPLTGVDPGGTGEPDSHGAGGCPA